MKKLGQLFPMLLLSCTLVFAAGCGTDTKNQDDMADNNIGQNDQNDSQMGTEAFDGSDNGLYSGTDMTGDTLTEGNDGALNNDLYGDNSVNGIDDVENGTGSAANGTTNGTGSMANGTDPAAGSTDTAGNTGNSENGAVGRTGNTVGNAAEDAGNTVGNAIDNVGNAAGNIIDDAGDAVGDVARDIGDGISDLSGDNKNNSATGSNQK